MTTEINDLVKRARAWADFAKGRCPRPTVPPVRNEETADTIERLQQRIAVLEKDAERYRWLRTRVSFHDIDDLVKRLILDADYDVEAPNVPVLAQVSNRIWYHATDDVQHRTLDELIDSALKGRENHRCQHCGNYECEHHQNEWQRGTKP